MRVKYVRGLQDTGGLLDNDIELLKRIGSVEAEGRLDDDMTRWLNGVTLSSSRYSEGIRHYYSPVGYVLEIDDDRRVLGNYAGDGSTGSSFNKSLNSPTYWGVYEDVRQRLNADETVREGWLAHAGDEATRAVADAAGAAALQAKLESYLQADHEDAVKSRLRDIVTSAATAGLHQHFADPVRTKSPLGPGLDPPGLTDAENAIRDAPGQEAVIGGRPVRYTESKLSARLVDVEATYFNRERGEYGAAPPPWRGEEWLQERARSARHAREKLIAGGNPAVELRELVEGRLQAAGHVPEPSAPMPEEVPPAVQGLMDLGATREQAEALLAAHLGDPDAAANAFLAAM
jgi:hypothetical protein